MDNWKVQDFWYENWNLIADNKLIWSLLDVLISLKESTGLDLGNAFIAELKKLNADTVECHKSIATLGIYALQIFIQANWTGPKVVCEELGHLGDIMNSTELKKLSLNFLELNGDDVYQLCCYPVLLFIANIILVEISTTLNLFKFLPIWSVKCIATHFAVLEEAGDFHFKQFLRVVNAVSEDENIFAGLPTNVLAEYYLDCSHLYLKFYDYKNVEECHRKVQDLLKIKISLTASLGKRTKFQEKDLPQMKLDVKVLEDRIPLQTIGKGSKDLPKDIALNDDTLLPFIRFVDGDSVKHFDLRPMDQALALSSCIYIQKSRPRDRLTHEEIMPFVESVLASPQSWSIQYKSLQLRCMIEFSNSRKAERALNQMETLADSIWKPTPKASSRLLYMHSVNMDPTWVNQRFHAQVLFSIGLIDSALEIFLRVHLWDDVITCYQRLGKHGQAEKVIREQLSIKETATLWCLLGDATVDKQYYEKAWEVSKYRNARAQRSLGLWYLRRQEFDKAIPYFQKSLELNCLQPGIAFSLGCSGMAVNKLDIAVKAFQQCVSIDHDNHEAWNNLASNFIRLGKLDQAYKALQEATRLSYDNWKIWENFLLVCTDIGAFEECLQCCHRLIDLERKEIDTEVLHILVEAVISDEKDFKEIPAGRLKPKLLKLFGHITSRITSFPNVWEEYAKLTMSGNTMTDKEKALQFLYKSHRCYTQNTDWEKSEELLPHVKRVTDKMIQVTKDVCWQEDFKARSVSLFSTTKMAISNLTLRLHKAYKDENNKVIESVQPFINELQEQIKELEALINSVC